MHQNNALRSYALSICSNLVRAMLSDEYLVGL